MRDRPGSTEGPLACVITTDNDDGDDDVTSRGRPTKAADSIMTMSERASEPYFVRIEAENQKQ